MDALHHMVVPRISLSTRLLLSGGSTNPYSFRDHTAEFQLANPSREDEGEDLAGHSEGRPGQDKVTPAPNPSCQHHLMDHSMQRGNGNNFVNLALMPPQSTRNGRVSQAKEMS